MLINSFNKLFDIVNKLFLSRLLVTFLAITLLTVLLFSGASIQQQHSANAVNHLSEVQENSSSIGSHNDQTLASRTLYSQAGAEVWEIQNNGFTRDVIGNPTVINNLRFPGQYFDEETNTYYNYHRNYNPNTGRYIQSDPIGLAGGSNTYAYVYSSPGNYVDPYGEFALPAAGCVLGMAIGAAARGMDGCDIRVEDLLTGCVAGALLGAGVGSLAKAAQASRAAKNAANARKAAKGIGKATSKSDDVIQVTKDGVALPPGAKHKIPDHYVQNPHRSGSYGEVVDGKFKERLRIDPPTPPGQKGPNYSHYHKDGKGTHYSPRLGDKDPGF